MAIDDRIFYKMKIHGYCYNLVAYIWNDTFRKYSSSVIRKLYIVNCTSFIEISSKQDEKLNHQNLQSKTLVALQSIIASTV